MTRRDKPLRAWLYGINPREFEFTSNTFTAGELRLKRRIEAAEHKAQAARDHLNALAAKFLAAIADDRKQNEALEKLYLEKALDAVQAPIRRADAQRRKQLEEITRLIEHDSDQRLLQRVRNTRSRNRWPR